MPVSFESAMAADKRLEAYLKKPPYNKYIVSYGIAELSVRLGKEELRAGECLEDFCLSVGLSQKPPNKIMWPQEMEGVRVFYTVARNTSKARKK